MGDNVTAKKTKTVTVRVRARVSFHDIRQGDEGTVPLDDVLQGWINAGLMEVIDGGETPARQSSPEPAAEGPVED